MEPFKNETATQYARTVICAPWALPSVWRPIRKYLLLDEPFAGMNHDETVRAVQMVREVRDRGVTVLLVEHDMQAVMSISERIVVLNFGEKIAEGTPHEIQQNEKVIERI